MYNRMKKQQYAYKQEAYKLLGEFENALTALEKNRANEDLIGRVFRALHTIKGSGNMFGYSAIAAFTHEVEIIYELVRKGKMSVSTELIDLSLSARNYISELLDACETDASVESEKAGSIINGLKALIPPHAFEKTISCDTSPDISSGASERPETTYLIQFRPSLDIFANGTNPVPLLDELSRLGHCHITAHTDDIPMLSDITPEYCYVFWDIVLITNKGRNAIEDLFVFVKDVCQITIQAVDNGDDLDPTLSYKDFYAFLIERGDLTPENITHMLESGKHIGEILTETGIFMSDRDESAAVQTSGKQDRREDEGG